MRQISIEIKLPPEQIGNPPVDEDLEIYYQARSFFMAGARCSTELWLSPNSCNIPVAPAVTLYAMSIELYIKLLCKISTGSYVRDHRIIEHFRRLPDKEMDSLSASYQRNIGRSRVQLEEDIALISDAFVDWRYLYEKREIWTSVTYLFQIAKVLHNRIREHRPDFSDT